MGIRVSTQRGGVLSYLYGDNSAPPVADRSALISGTYNPVDYSGPPRLGGNYATNRVGILTDPANLTAAEPAGALITYSTNGQTISDTAFYRRVSVTGQNITFQNCIFYGTDGPAGYDSSGNATGSMSCSRTQVNATFVDCTFTARSPEFGKYAAQVGLGGGTFLRCDFYGTDDGLVNSNGNSVSSGQPVGWAQQWNIIQCAFHDLLYFSPYGTAPGGIDDNASHTDCLQWSGGSAYVEGCGFWSFFDMSRRSQADGVETGFGPGSTTDNTNQRPYHFWGNKYTDTVADPGDAHSPATWVGRPSIYPTSCMMLSPALGNVTSFTMTKCYLNGATWPLNISPNYWTVFGGFAGPFVFTQNKIGRNHRWGQHGSTEAIIANSNLHGLMTISGNTDLATGAALGPSQLLKAG